MPSTPSQSIDELLQELLQRSNNPLSFEELTQQIEQVRGAEVHPMEVREAVWRLIASGRAVLTSQRTLSSNPSFSNQS